MSTPSKKLIWFRSEMMIRYGGPNNRLRWKDWLLNEIWYPEPESQNLQWHLAMKSALMANSFMVDGTGLSKIYGDGMDIMRLPHNNGEMSFDLMRGQCIDDCFGDMIRTRVSEAYTQASRIGADRIYLSYSGGSDSCLAVSAFLSHPETLRWVREDRIELLATRMSQREDPLMWSRLRQIGIRIRPIDYGSLLDDDSKWMLVSGEGEPYGTFFLRSIDPSIDQSAPMLQEWRQIEPVFLDRDPSGLAWDYFSDLMNRAPFDVNTVHQAFWWLENCIDRQDDMMRYNVFSTMPKIRTDCIGHGQRCFYFLGGQDFADHAAYVILRKRPKVRDLIKFKSDQYTSRWMGYDEVAIKPKFYSQDRVPRMVNKLRIFSDWSWDNQPILHDCFAQ